jgi:penicillin amidase
MPDLLAALARLGLTQLDRARLPKLEGRLRLPALQAPAEVIRDRWGVPHIYAESHQDVLCAQGFVHAQDRLWQMEFNRRLVAGRLSELLGAVSVPLDRWMRTLTLRRVAEQELALLDSETRADLQVYADGVNAYLAQGPLPVELLLLRHTPEPWQVVDTLAWIKMMAWQLSVNWETEILRAQLIARLGPERAAELEPTYAGHWPLVLPADMDYARVGRSALERAQAGRPFTGPGPHAGLGSNNWLIGGARTATGRPLLANDMHLGMTMPAIWYENHLCGGDLHVTGVTFPGIPAVVAGHNTHVAWGYTNGFADVQDLYMEHLRRTDDGQVQYEYQGEWHAAQVQREVIRVKGGPPVTEDVVVTRHGPIINTLAAEEMKEAPLALRWTALEPDTMVAGLRLINRARNCLEFREALRHWNAPGQNTVYADTDGNIAYTLSGRVPIRAKGDGRVPVPGWTGEYDWTGYIPFDDMPQALNPAQGYVASANNRVVGDDYAYELGRDVMSGDRAQRIAELIESQPRIDAAFIQNMHFDQVSPSARVIGRYLAELTADEADLAEIVQRMRAWDGRLSADSAEAAVYQVFARRLLRLTLERALSQVDLHTTEAGAVELRRSGLLERYLGKGPTPVIFEGSLFSERSWEWLQRILAEPASPWFDLGHGETRAEAMRRALRETADFLKAACGPRVEDWAWGKLHTLTFGHVMGSSAPLKAAFNRGPYPIGGDGNTVWATNTNRHDLNSEAVTGPPFRSIVDVGEWDNSLSLLAPGQSGHPASPHYDDQITAWFERGYHPMPFSRESVERVAEARLRLERA